MKILTVLLAISLIITIGVLLAALRVSTRLRRWFEDRRRRKTIDRLNIPVRREPPRTEWTSRRIPGIGDPSLANYYRARSGDHDVVAVYVQYPIEHYKVWYENGTTPRELSLDEFAKRYDAIPVAKVVGRVRDDQGGRIGQRRKITSPEDALAVDKLLQEQETMEAVQMEARIDDMVRERRSVMPTDAEIQEFRRLLDD